MTKAPSPVRVLIAKVGLDGHDRGARYIAQGLRDRGYEVIYTGIRRSPAEIVTVALQEDVRVLGLSILSGGQMELIPRVLKLLNEQGLGEIIVCVGGIIPPDDAAALRSLGVSAVFGPGTTIGQIDGYIREHLDANGQPG